MENGINIGYVVNAFVFSLVGLLVFTVSFYLFDRLTPYNLWKEILEEHNIALAVVVGAISIGICIIISSAIHG
jgi:uncharacterized membrane protein YjfL (UPF0719 family)